MEQGESTLDVVFGIGFKVGFLVVVVGLIMFYMPMVDSTVNMTLDLMGFWESFRALPEWIQVVTVGFMLAGAAVVVGALKDLVTMFVDSLLGRED